MTDEFSLDIPLQDVAMIQLKAQALKIRTDLEKNIAEYKETGGDRKTLILVDKKINKILKLSTGESWGKISSAFSSLRRIKSAIQKISSVTIK